ncbi:MAG: 16S rRNA (guanine(966)-N(2))-methyltransferase RsmD [Gammaproteobacteria bacterium]|nr:16S rRNA (guanine(966)-N(2))-methyltransferase RsmD [Gammaproteobacteria bacterium]MDH3465190.1 16S rRNA (guanine(966)-N(2))-methyltransferase RsmD [Gammaproteobacteria bacterium]
MPKHNTARVRIIGGVWRRRIFKFPTTPELRPTSDRARETLFNWLAPHISGRRCLDLFAGSGALGFEAASRGAQSVVMVDNDQQVIQQLRDNRTSLGATQIDIVAADALRYVDSCDRQFDLIFVDPPFHLGLTQLACASLLTSQCLQGGGFVYVECGLAESAAINPRAWLLHKQCTYGAVNHRLFIAQTHGAHLDA